MNNKYKTAFKHVTPDKKCIERIFDMTEKKKMKFRPLLITAVIIALLVSCILSANAITDGAVFEKIIVFINGNEKNQEDVSYNYHTEINDKGETEKHYKFEITGENGEKGELEFKMNKNGVVINSGGNYGFNEGFKAEIYQDEEKTELYVPTTVSE